MTEMWVTANNWRVFKQWLKRHGWLLCHLDYERNLLLFVADKPLYNGQTIEAQFATHPSGGVVFCGYEVVQ